MRSWSGACSAWCNCKKKSRFILARIHDSTDAPFFNDSHPSHASSSSRHPSARLRKALKKPRLPQTSRLRKPLLGRTCWQATAKMMFSASLTAIRFSRECCNESGKRPNADCTTAALFAREALLAEAQPIVNHFRDTNMHFRRQPAPDAGVFDDVRHDLKGQRKRRQGGEHTTSRFDAAESR